MRRSRAGPLGILIVLTVLGAIVTASGATDRDGGGQDDADAARIADAAFAPFMPLAPDQELHVVVDVEAYGPHDSAFDRWTYDIWRRWDEHGDLHEGIVVQRPEGDQVTQIVLHGDTHTMSWGPENTLYVFDVPLEYGVWRRLVGGPLAQSADADDLQIEREGRRVEVLYSWVDRYAREFNYVSRAEVLINPDSNQIEALTWLIDRPEQEPYPVRTFTFRKIEMMPEESSPEGTYSRPTVR